MTFAEQYDTYRLFMEEDLKARCQHWDVSPEILSESMRYSLLAGGKRIRPVLFFAALDALGADWKVSTPIR